MAVLILEGFTNMAGQLAQQGALPAEAVGGMGLCGGTKKTWEAGQLAQQGTLPAEALGALAGRGGPTGALGGRDLRRWWRVRSAASLILSCAGMGPQPAPPQHKPGPAGNKARREWQQQQARSGPLREAAVEGLCRHAWLMDVRQVLELLPRGGAMCAAGDPAIAAAMPALARCALQRQVAHAKLALDALIEVCGPAAEAAAGGSGGAGGGGGGGLEPGGRWTRGPQLLADALRREWRVVLPAEAGAPGPAFRTVQERGLDRLAQLVADPASVLDVARTTVRVSYLQASALRALTLLLLGADPLCGLQLLAAPGVARGMLRMVRLLRLDCSNAEAAASGAASMAATFALCAVAAAVPRWRRAAAEGRLLACAAAPDGAAAEAAPESPAGAAGRKKKGAAAGGVEPPPLPPLPPPPPAALTVRGGLRAAADLLERCTAPQLPPGLAPMLWESMGETDVLLYGIMEAVCTANRAAAGTAGGGGAGGGPVAVLEDTAMRAALAAQVRALLAEVAPGGAEEDAAAAAAEAAEAVEVAAKECAHCGVRAGERAGLKLRKCTGCLAVRYCSGECQAAAWPAHKRECKTRPPAASG
ncbi:hypothetical protein TSOC_003726 [Tetrabaena socialis]|uniref:MYND-type domain-containing protein n=1 Tax=Tetrabaena socialis TaxID=47790 RepID=A0A2J8AAU6_9CHLO|nr:hypothetical protein TSOC_003726 [Tetrabaena socialis]|eukprot:PNH09644.1 hypothetical protein TSOC_003726 [Tetrabaena socialis]